jgi:hypothetical protein
LCSFTIFLPLFKKKNMYRNFYDEWKLLQQTYKPYSFWVTRLVGKCILSKVTFGWLNFTHCYVVCALSAAILFLVFCSFSWILSFAVRSTTWISYLLRMFYHWFALNYIYIVLGCWTRSFDLPYWNLVWLYSTIEFIQEWYFGDDSGCRLPIFLFIF